VRVICQIENERIEDVDGDRIDQNDNVEAVDEVEHLECIDCDLVSVGKLKVEVDRRYMYREL
jgi:hypothetical protein